MQTHASAHPIWPVLQWVGIIATTVLIAGLVIEPEPSLSILWFVLVPILPATFLISPAIWRGSCPLASLNMLFAGSVSRRTLKGPLLRYAGAIGIILLVVMVPARRFLFNENGLILAVTVVAVGVAALVLGLFFDFKAGFCNSICPVLPVEKLYGQGPLVKIKNARCKTCPLCTEKGCIDLTPRRSLLLGVGPARKTKLWVLRPYGLFAAAFPGFVFGYFQTVDGPLASFGEVYLTIFAWSAVSWVAIGLLTLITGIRSSTVVPALGGLAVGIYYWFTGPAIAVEFALQDWVGILIRAAAIVLIGFWMWEKYADTGTFRPNPVRE